jgi:hypothetical protein
MNKRRAFFSDLAVSGLVIAFASQASRSAMTAEAAGVSGDAHGTGDPRDLKS